MEQLEENFTSTLKKFLIDYLKFDANETAKKLLKLTETKKIDFKKTAKKVDANIRDFRDMINEKNDDLFKSSFSILPGVDMQRIWSDVDSKHRDRLWLSLRILAMSSEMISSLDTTEKKCEEMGIDFDPFTGVKGGDLNTESIKDSIGEFDIGDGGIDSLMKLIGTDQMEMLNKLTDQLNNMTDEEIDSATENIKHMLGGTSNDMNEMLKVITKELKNTKLNGSENGKDIFKTISSLAESVSQKMKPRIESGEINGDNLFSSAENLMNKIVPGKNMEELLKKFGK